jgi:hypothetical protein
MIDSILNLGAPSAYTYGAGLNTAGNDYNSWGNTGAVNPYTINTPYYDATQRQMVDPVTQQPMGLMEDGSWDNLDMTGYSPYTGYGSNFINSMFDGGLFGDMFGGGFDSTGSGNSLSDDLSVSDSSFDDLESADYDSEMGLL